jgi:hypothetical protein
MTLTLKHIGIQTGDVAYSQAHCDYHICQSIASTDDLDDEFFMVPDVFCIAALTRFLLSGQEREILALSVDHCVCRTTIGGHVVFIQKLHGPYAALVVTKGSILIYMLKLNGIELSSEPHWVIAEKLGLSGKLSSGSMVRGRGSERQML